MASKSLQRPADRRPGKCRKTVAGAALCALSALTGEPPAPVEVVPLAPLMIEGQPARAHTQGLEILAGTYYVTARREDVAPKRALLLRIAREQREWDVWDITPGSPGVAGKDEGYLDHPGGFQAGGGKLWIPLAESRPHARTLIRAYALADLEPHKPARPAFEFSVDDHIGAVAVSNERRLLVGANWDTERVCLWDLDGTFERALAGAELTRWGLGVADGPDGRPGLAVQDWKIAGSRILASGLRRVGGTAGSPQESWLMSLPAAFNPSVSPAKVRLPEPDGMSLAREGMAVAEGDVYFLPEDLGATNRLLRVTLTELGL
jgi:hypothetical protein